MQEGKKSIVIIPARLASTRLPQKALADIDGKPMLFHVWSRAVAAKLGPVVIATCGAEIGDVMRSYGATVVETDPNLPSGTDRVWAALQQLPDKNYDYVINLQGDLPNIDHDDFKKVINPLVNDSVDIVTLAAPIQDNSEINNPSVVKIAMSKPENNIGQAFYFSRSPIPYGADRFYHHIGVYAYRQHVLEKFVGLPPSSLEKSENLEQLRGLEKGMKFAVVVVDKAPQSVDTAHDLELVRQYFAK